VLIYDRSHEIVFPASQGYDGRPPNGPCLDAMASEAGACVLFKSGASNLVPGDTNNTFDIFLYDWSNDRLECISTDPQGATGDFGSLECDMSDDGRVIAFISMASNLVPDDGDRKLDIFLWQR
jgi:hypothetical protein